MVMFRLSANSEVMLPQMLGVALFVPGAPHSRAVEMLRITAVPYFAIRVAKGHLWQEAEMDLTDLRQEAQYRAFASPLTELFSCCKIVSTCCTQTITCWAQTSAAVFNGLSKVLHYGAGILIFFVWRQFCGVDRARQEIVLVVCIEQQFPRLEDNGLISVSSGPGD